MIKKLDGKPQEEGVYFVDSKEDWSAVYLERLPWEDGKLHCPIWGDDPKDWPEGTYYGPVSIEDILGSQSQDLEIHRLRSLVSIAYHEGFGDCCLHKKEEPDWANSDAKTALGDG